MLRNVVEREERIAVARDHLDLYRQRMESWRGEGREDMVLHFKRKCDNMEEFIEHLKGQTLAAIEIPTVIVRMQK